MSGWNCQALSLVIVLTIAASAQGQGDTDDFVFREGLRQWGLTSWLQQYLTDNPPANAVDESLRRRERLLDEAQQPGTPLARRDTLVTQASGVLEQLLKDNQQHPNRCYWYLEWVRDVFERRDPGIFDRLLLYELPGRERVQAHALSEQALTILHDCRDEVANGWKKLEALDEKAIERLTAAGAFREWERLDGQSAFVLCWATLYNTLSSAALDKEQLQDLLDKITQRYAWTQLPAGQNAQRCQALLMAALAARYLGQFPEAEGYAREVISASQKVQSAADRARMKTATLVGILEQIRIFIDGGKLDDAGKAIEQAKEWARRQRRDDLTTQLALALLERKILARRASSPATTQSDESILKPVQALTPLEELAQKSPINRDAIYRALAGAIESEPVSTIAGTFPLQLLAGAAVCDVPSAPHQRRSEIVAAIQKTLLSPDHPKALRGELLYLQGSAEYLNQRYQPAIAALCDLVEHYPDHDRISAAAGQAVTIAEEWLQHTDAQQVSPARQALIKTGQLLRKRSPESATIQKLQYYIALAFEQEGQLDTAASEYAAVPAGDANRPKATYARARCLKKLWQQSSTSRPADEVMQAAQKAIEESGDGGDLCMAADAALNLADLLNNPSVAKPDQALAVLNDFEKKFPTCSALVVQVLGQRIIALRQLKRFAETHQVVADFLKVNSEQAGPMMAKLLEAMHDEVELAADRGDDAAVRSISKEIVELAQTILDWSHDHAGRMSTAQEATIGIWRAWALLAIGQTAEAMTIFNMSATDTQPATGLDIERRLGQAECLLATDKAAEALPLFTEIWKTVPERTPHWWQGLVGSLQCHTRIGSDPHQIVQAVRQQRVLSPDLGGPRWKRLLEKIEGQSATTQNGANPAP